MSICLCIILSKQQNVLPYSASDWLVSSLSCFPCLVFVSSLVRQPFRCGPEHQLQRTAQLPDQLMDAIATLRSWSGLAKLANEHRDSTLHSAFLSLVLQTLHFSSMGSSVLSANVFSLQGGEGVRVQPDIHWLFLQSSSPHYRHTLTPAQWQHTVDTKRKGKKTKPKNKKSICVSSVSMIPVLVSSNISRVGDSFHRPFLTKSRPCSVCEVQFRNLFLLCRFTVYSSAPLTHWHSLCSKWLKPEGWSHAVFLLPEQLAHQ